MINEELLVDIRNYIKNKTGIYYFKDIRQTPNNLIVTCPFHKDGQESKPSATIRTTVSDKTSVGVLHCFTCGISISLANVLKQLLGPLYNENEVESLFQLKLLAIQSKLETHVKEPLFKIPEKHIVKENILRSYRQYHPYLASRNISEETAKIYDIGYDSANRQITFPIRNIKKECIGIGRRSIDKKFYRYPSGMQKPLYGVYELDKFLNYVFIVEGPFNLWSLREWGKQGVALLGTGTESQYKEILKLNTNKFVLALDPDEAGIYGTYKLGNYLTGYGREVNVAILPEGKDINDLSYEEFKSLNALTYKEWFKVYKKYLNFK